MSKHILRITSSFGVSVIVEAGWDRPLQGFFLQIQRIDVDPDDDDYFIFNNLDMDDPNPRSFDIFDDVLDQLGIDLPLVMRAEILVDGARNEGNRTVRWNADGTVQEHRDHCRGVAAG